MEPNLRLQDHRQVRARHDYTHLPENARIFKGSFPDFDGPGDHQELKDVDCVAYDFSAPKGSTVYVRQALPEDDQAAFLERVALLIGESGNTYTNNYWWGMSRKFVIQDDGANSIIVPAKVAVHITVVGPVYKSEELVEVQV